MNTQALLAPIDNTKIRMTEDGRVSVFDIIQFIADKKAPHKVWERLCADFPEVLTKCHNFKFTGRGQRETPVADAKTTLEILSLVKRSKVGAKIREEAFDKLARFLNGDITLADEVLQINQNPKDQQWLAVRAQSKYVRAIYTGVLQSHGVVADGYGRCTNAIYEPILGGKTSVVKQNRGLPESANLRDHLPSMELTAVMFAESGASTIIEKKDAFGNAECELLSSKAAAIVAGALRDMELLAA